MAEAREVTAESSQAGILGAELLAEYIGTFILVFIGDGAVTVSVALQGYNLGAVALLWGVGVALAVYAAGAISGGHFNAAVTLAFAAFTDFEWRRVVPYIAAQLAGAFTAAAAIYVSFSGIISAFETKSGLVRGEPGSQLSAMVFNTYAPNPAAIGTNAAAMAQVSHVTWFATEAIMTAILLFGIFFLVEERNAGRPLANFEPVMIGLLVAALVAYGGTVSMTAINPSRDFGPRLFAFIAGWGDIAIPGPRAGFWIPIVAPIVGGLIGGAIYHFVYKRAFPAPAPPGEEPPEAVGR